MNMKKLFLLNLPYLLFVYPFDKLAQAFRLAPGADLSGKLLSIGDGFTAALSSPWLSFHPTDLLIGIAGAVVLRMAVYLKGKNAKKYRHGIEYGSARWGTAADIAAAAKSAISVKGNSTVSVSYGGDVNGTGHTDINDAQYVYDLYNAKHSALDMEKFLRCDVNGDRGVNVGDVRMVVSLLLR